MLKKPRWAGKLPKVPEKAFELAQEIIERGNLEQINLFEMKFNQFFINQINFKFNKRNPKLDKIEKLYHRYIIVQLQLFKLKLTSFEEQLLYLKNFVFPDQDKNEQAEEDESKEIKPVTRMTTGKIAFACEYSATLKTRICALKCIDNLLQYTNLHTFKARDVINFASLIVPFVFKVASSPFEEPKEIGMRIFHLIFKVTILI